MIISMSFVGTSMVINMENHGINCSKTISSLDSSWVEPLDVTPKFGYLELARSGDTKMTSGDN